MRRIVSTPDSGGFDRGPQYGPAGDLLVAEVRELEQQLEPSPEFIAEQTRIVDDELAALLAEDVQLPHESDVIPGFEALTWADLAEARRIGDLLDRELPTHDRAAQPVCPPWCLYADADAHTDGYDDPDTSEHVGARHTIQVTRGGATFGQPAVSAAVSVHLEQTRNIGSEPLVVLTLNIDDAEYETYLGVAEAAALRGSLAHATNEIDEYA